MKLTPFAKIFITLVVLAVVGYVVWQRKGGRHQEVGGGREGPAGHRRDGPLDR
ncbi:MAG TPA: hypothetical protein VMK12_15960 [Anaeromyxobacteraceae bacterium]|nr:hypothetical protein [Anaeromyxobacteraceae bacterium]